MQIRESNMPDEKYWESLFNIPLILDSFGIDGKLKDIVELGCGYGTFTIPTAKRITGTLYTFDIDNEMVTRTNLRLKKEGLKNVVCKVRDVIRDGYGLPECSVDACLLFNILHAENPILLLSESARIVKKNGYVFIIHWVYDSNTPRGPSLDIRPKPKQIIEWAEKTKQLELEGSILNLPPWHYGFKFKKC